MALTRTVRVGAASAVSFGTGPYTPAGQPFTPATGSILVAAVEVGFTSSAGTWDPTIADDNADGGTWTQRASVTVAGGWTSGIRVWTRPVVTGASMSVTFDQGAVNVGGGYAVSIIEYSGQDGVTPQFGATAKTAAAVDGADSVTLTSAPAVDDEAIGFLGREMNTGTATSTQGGAFTELQDFTTSAGCGMETEVRTGSTSTTVDWADLNTAAGDVFRVHLATIGITAAAGPAAGLTADPLALFELLYLERALPVWAGSPGGDAPTGDITVDASVDVGIATASTVTADVSATGNTEVGVVSRSSPTADVSALTTVEVGTVTRSAVTPQPSVVTSAVVGVGSRSTVTPEPSAVSQAFVGVAPRSQPAADTDLTVTAGVFVGIVSRSTVTPEPSAVTTARVGVISRTTATADVSAGSRAQVGVVGLSTVTPAPSATTSVVIGVVPRSDLTPSNDVTVTAAVVVGVVSRSTYIPAPAATATIPVGVVGRAAPTITVSGTSRVLVGVVPTSQATLTVVYTSKTYIGIVTSATLTPLAVILVDRIDVWTEPGPATYEEPSPILWLEPTKANHEEPEPAGWREPSPAQGVS
jgi:hypothetical protein